MGFQRISVEKARELIDNENVQVVDIRDAASYDAGHIENAERIDGNNIEDYIQRADLECPLIVCCYHGNMSQGAADYFVNNGFKDAYSLDGGFTAWRQSEPD